MFFDGDHQKKRVVSIRGQSQQAESASRIVEQNRLARELREQERKRQQAASKIQKWWRTHSARLRVLVDIEADWARVMASLQENIASAIPERILFQHFARFNVFFRSKKKRHIAIMNDFVKFIGLILNNNPKTNPIITALNSTDQVDFASVLGRTLLCFLRLTCLQSSRRTKSTDSIPRPLVIFLVNYFLTPANLSQVPASRAAMIQENLVKGATDAGMFDYLESVLLEAPIMTEGTPESVELQLVCRLVSKVLATPAKNNTIHYITRFASIPQLERRIPNQIQVIHSQLQWAHFQSLEKGDVAHLVMDLQQKSDIAPLFALLDLVSFLRSTRTPPPSDCVAIIVMMLSEFLASIPEGVIFEDTRVRVDHDQVTVSADRVETIVALINSSYQTLHGRLELLHGKNLCVQLFQWIGLVSEDDLALIQILSFYNKIMNIFPRQKITQVMVCLIFHTDYLKRAWQFLLHAELSQAFMDRPTISRDLDRTNYSVLGFFCRTFETYMSLVDDSEFFSENMVLGVDGAASVMMRLRDLSFSLLTSPREPPLYVRENYRSWVALLQQLSARNVRKRFVSDERLLLPAATLLCRTDASNTRVISVLRDIPFVISFNDRVEIFQSRTYQASRMQMFGSSRRIRVRRTHIVEDALAELEPLTFELKSQIRVEFIDADGGIEPGVDGGGLFKEFITELSKAIFDVRKGLFKETHDRSLYPNPLSYLNDPDHSLMTLAGKVTGMAILRSIHFRFKFASTFLRRLLGKRNTFDTLSSVDPELAQNLNRLKEYDADTLDSLMLYFTISRDEYGNLREIDLIPQGSNIQVNTTNVREYIKAVSDYHLNRSNSAQCSAFIKGLSYTSDLENLRLFNEPELSMLFSGIEDDINVRDWMENTHYGGASQSDPVIVMFWNVVQSLSREEKRKLLQFVTSSDCAPLLGFKHLYPPFTIQVIPDQEGALPTASTCANLLKLRSARSETDMKEKILLAIHNSSGFYLA